MTNSFAITRAHLIYGVCLPVAVVIGYLLAEPMESGSMAVVVLVLSILSIPLLMRWHHTLLVMSINSVILPYFLPGRPNLWMVMVMISLFFLALDRSLGRDVQFLKARWVSYSLIFLGVVVVATAWLNGGLGIAALGSSTYGGRKYVGVLAAICLYFALSTTDIKPGRAKLYLAFYFLSSLLLLVSYSAAFWGRPFYFLVELFPIEGTVNEGIIGQTVAGPTEISRFSTLAMPGFASCCFLLAMFGAKGILDWKKPWKFGMLCVAIIATSLGGYRSELILVLLLFGALFYAEGLFRTKYVWAVILGTTLGGIFLATSSRSLPPPIQRTLSFVPYIDLDPDIRMNAQGSTDWRVEIWKRALPEVPKHLIKGKGYAIDPQELEAIQMLAANVASLSEDGALLSGDYHSGPLSLIIPFGLFGVAAFAWFLVASIKALHRNYVYGDPECTNINRFLLCYFVMKLVFFVTIFGGFSSDMVTFTGLIGMSVSLNGGVRQPLEPKPEPAMDELLSAEV